MDESEKDAVVCDESRSRAELNRSKSVFFGALTLVASAVVQLINATTAKVEKSR